MENSFFDTVRKMQKNDEIIKEEKYKQILFQKLLMELGYLEEEIEFEVPVNGNIEGQIKRIFAGIKKADIVCGDILFEIKSSDVIINKGVALRQALEYNMILGKKIICISNFTNFQIYNIEGENICNLNINMNVECLKVCLLQSLGKYSIFKGKKIVSFETITEENSRFKKDKIEIEKILDFISQIKILSLQNDFEILPIMDTNFDIGLDWKSNINREPWVEALNKVLFESRYDVINKKILNIKQEVEDLRKCFPIKYGMGNNNYILKDPRFESAEKRRKYKNYFREKFLSIEKVSNEIKKELDDMSRLSSNIFSYWYSYNM